MYNQNQQTKIFWNAAECAAALGDLKPKTFLEKYAPRPDFPKRINIPNSRKPLWKSQEVIKWAEQFQEY
ncbi:MAG: hypothetical protein Q4A84_10980 [Neisseria sp.]|uniref:hypothetical protein n=1 Tax=Neisseria sp. TaxID=192066 RepID=UPI0026DB1624|nr:hypothetical protein [Neisseria sp.]MDO4642202.1 hypothetical protein [Neisseria sp.]